MEIRILGTPEQVLGAQGHMQTLETHIPNMFVWHVAGTILEIEPYTTPDTLTF